MQIKLMFAGDQQSASYKYTSILALTFTINVFVHPCRGKPSVPKLRPEIIKQYSMIDADIKSVI